MRRGVYSGFLKLKGEESRDTLGVANNCASSLLNLKRFKEAKEFLREKLPVARRTLGKNDMVTLLIMGCYAEALCRDPASTLDDVCEAASTLVETARTTRRVMGGAHPLTAWAERNLRYARARVSPEEWRAAARGVKITI